MRVMMVFAGLSLVHLSQALASGPSVFQSPAKPDDIRLQAPKDLNGYFPFVVPATRDAWVTRAASLKHRLATVLGVWPEPEKTPLNVVIHSQKDMGDYSVANVYFESFPGFYVTGNLYRPKNISGKIPGILSPHGHWSGGRFYDNANAAREVADGAERFPDEGRSPLQSRCVQLARMGCLVFHYDMIGYADSVQISEDLAHRFARQRPELSRGDRWGLFSPKAESLYQSVMGLQTWNSIRALDFLCTLPEVDTRRLGVTGASGGGTQSFLLAALDDRISMSFPAVMVSTGMQGGCTCENACGLRIGTGNVEIAALFAPKPQGLTSADDWTREMESKGFPELRKLYQLMGAGDRVSLKPLTHFGHNYNAVSRHAMYEWVNKHFDLNQNSPILEKNFTRLTRDQMSVWNDHHPVPPSGEEFEVDLLKRMAESNMKYLLDLAESDPEKLRSIVISGWQVVVGRGFAESGQVQWKLTGKSDKGTYLEMSGTLDNTTYHESLPVVFLHPKSQWNGRTRLLISSQGKSALYNPDGSITAEVAQHLARGSTVLGVDLFHQGEFLDQGQDVSQTRSVENPRESAAYTLGYNHSLCAQRIHDVMTTVQFLHTFEKGPSKVDLSSDREMAPIALAAAALAGAEKVHSLDADTGDFAFHEIHSIRHPDFLPGATRFGDVRGLKFLLGIED